MNTFPPAQSDSKYPILQANKASLAYHLWAMYKIPGQSLP